MYQTVAMQALQKQYPEAGEGRRPFVARLIRAAQHVEQLYGAIMRRHDDDPSGIEFRHVSYLRWAIVLPDASEPGKTRIQFFTPSGLDTHRAFHTLEEAVEQMVSEGYVVEQRGTLDSLAVGWRQRVKDKTETQASSA